MEISRSNSEKLDRLLTEFAELKSIVKGHHTLLHGRDAELGLAHMVRVMWRGHVWLLCTLSAAIGVIGTLTIEKFFGVHP